MKLSPPRRKPQGEKTRYCIYCNEELGADPSRCIYCGAPRANPLGATSLVRHDVRDPLWGPGSRQPASKPSWKRRFVWLLISLPAVAAVGANIHGYGGAVLVGSISGILPLIHQVATWAARKNRIKWGVFFSVAEVFTAVCLAVGGVMASAVSLGWLSVHKVTSCYGGCTGRIGGVSAFVLVAAGVAVLAVLIVVALLLVTRARSGARLAAARVTQRVPGAGRGSLPGSERWGVTSREPAARPTRRW